MSAPLTPRPETLAKAEAWAHRLGDGRWQCDLCPRHCKLREGQRGFCFIRAADEEGVKLQSYGRASGFCIDPIEKKPLYHFHPGQSILSFGNAGCNLGCRFCQNWDISKAQQHDVLSSRAAPEDIAHAAVEQGCLGLAFTYNDPVIFAEYAIDCAMAAHERGLANVAVTAGYIGAEARADFFEHIDAVNVDLKAFSEEFYRRQCYGSLEPVLDTLRWLAQQRRTWFEITTLVIPGLNDSDQELGDLCEWILDDLGPEVPLHFSAFHPDFKLSDIEPTPPETLIKARHRALATGLKYVYTGNIDSPNTGSTYCECGERVIERRYYSIGDWRLDEHGACTSCGRSIAGVFAARPGRFGTRRRPLHILEHPTGT